MGLPLCSLSTKEKENIDERPAPEMINRMPEIGNPGEQLAGENRTEKSVKGERPVNEGDTTSVPPPNDAEVARYLPEGKIVNEHPNEINTASQSLVTDSIMNKSSEEESAIGRSPMKDMTVDISPITDDTVAKSMPKDDKSDKSPGRSNMVDNRSIITVKIVAKSCSASTETVEIAVGQDEEVLSVNPKVLTQASPFFLNALEGGWKESLERLIKLLKDGPRVVKAYMHFLGIGEIDIASASANQTNESLASISEQMLAAEFYLFAEKTRGSKAKNGAVRAMIKAIMNRRRLPYSSFMRAIYEGTPRGSPMRRMMVDLFVQADAATSKNLTGKNIPKKKSFGCNCDGVEGEEGAQDETRRVCGGRECEEIP